MYFERGTNERKNKTTSQTRTLLLVVIVIVVVAFSSFALLLLDVAFVEILGLIERQLVGNEVRQRRDDGDENLLLDASNGLVALTETIKRAGGDVAGHDHQGSRLLGLGHGGEDEHGRDGLEVDAEFSVFESHAVGEVAAEGLGAAVRAEVGGGEEAVRGRDGDDGTSLGFAHAGQDEVGEAEDGLAVDNEDVNFLARVEGAEGLVVGVGEADVVDEDGDVDLGEFLEQLLVLGVSGGGEVEGEGLGLNLVLGLDVRAQVFENVLAAGNDDDVESALGEFDGVRFADAGGGTSDDGPFTGLAVFGLHVGLDEEVEADEADKFEGNDEEDDGSDEFEDALETNGHDEGIFYFRLDFKFLLLQ